MAPGPPWFVHVDISASRDQQECAWLGEERAHRVTGALLNLKRTRAISVSYAVTLHTWTSIFRFNADGVNRAVRLYPGPSLPHVP
jgi:hypothetical protein